MGRTRGALRRSTVERGLLVLGGLLAGLVLLEIGVRVGFGDRLENVYEVPFEYMATSDVPGVPYLYRADIEEFTNNLGLRMPHDVPAIKPSGSLRLLLLADSAGESIDGGAGTGDLFPCLLEGLLEARLGRKVEVLNLSVPGLSFEQERLLLEDRLRTWDADAAIIAFNYNDPVETNVRELLNIPVQHWFELANAVLLVRYQLRQREGDWYTPGSEIYQELEASFAALGRTARGFPVFLAPLPLNFPPERPQPHIPTVTELCGRNGVPVLDVYSAVREDLPGFMMPDASEDWNHYNARGHAAIARALAERLEPHLRPLAHP
ncbi:MAG: SGNH/GDSL hydrolase family protein [Pseudomonadota bacterium]